MTHIMKTTMDIDDSLLIAAKATAARRRMTLKAVVEHALRREIEPVGYGRSDAECCYEVNERGMPYLKSSGGKQMTSEMVYDLMDEEGI
ncbi:MULTISPECIES: hypothetical protein [unclassified Lentimonas]|uniref:hypothetical protein n=2 Tax=unclassified Lentimonas TaxID=2630993 RepID=UPI001389C35D|nr:MULTISPECIES: hypothetical protein [unclassified Lentimonas]